MYSIDEIIGSMKNLSNTTSIPLAYDDILLCDEDVVRTSESFIKQYYHFTYESAGVVKCKVMKGKGEYIRQIIKSVKGIGLILSFLMIQELNRCWIYVGFVVIRKT
jgi:hypothetical protein